MNSLGTRKSLFSAIFRALRATDFPGFIAAALLAAQVFLLLKEHFRATAWVPIGLGPPGPEGKGWAVVYALAVVAVAVALLLIRFLDALLFGLRFQFSIRWLLCFVVLAAIPCSWFAVAEQQAHRQKAAVDTVKRLGGLVCYDYETTGVGSFAEAPCPTPLFWRQLLGDDFFADVYLVRFTSDVDLRCLEDLDKVRILGLDATSDDGLWPVARLTNLMVLFLEYTNVTDAGLVHLEGLKNLRELTLPRRVTDAGLVHLKGLTNLRGLGAQGTGVTEKGVRELRAALPGCDISYGHGVQ